MPVVDLIGCSLRARENFFDPILRHPVKEMPLSFFLLSLILTCLGLFQPAEDLRECTLKDYGINDDPNLSDTEHWLLRKGRIFPPVVEVNPTKAIFHHNVWRSNVIMTQQQLLKIQSTLPKIGKEGLPKFRIWIRSFFHEGGTPSKVPFNQS